MNFKVLVTPDEGYWAGGRFVFSIAIPAAYPHEAPKVHCDTRVRFPSTNSAPFPGRLAAEPINSVATILGSQFAASSS